MSPPPREREEEAARETAVAKRALPVLASGAEGARQEARIEARIEADRGRGGGGRVHILTGAICNNNCVFCMEEDRDGRYETNSRTDDELVRTIVRTHPDAEEICFTSGEPTTNKRFPYWVKLARDEGARRVSVMTNGRALGHEPYTKLLVAAGLRRVYVSIHGHTAKLHEGLTRTPDSFAQTVEGLRTAARFKPHGVELHTSTVVTKRNLPHVLDIYRFLRGLGVDQVVFNVMQANGRANTYFEHIFPTYTETALTFAAAIEEARRTEARPMAFLVDIPLCTTEAVPDFHRGYVESYSHYEQAGNGTHDERLVPKEGANRLDGGLVEIARDDLDRALRAKRDACRTCRYDRVCEGVWTNYLERFGWDEMVPVAATR